MIVVLWGTPVRFHDVVMTAQRTNIQSTECCHFITSSCTHCSRPCVAMCLCQSMRKTERKREGAGKEKSKNHKMNKKRSSHPSGSLLWSWMLRTTPLCVWALLVSLPDVIHSHLVLICVDHIVYTNRLQQHRSLCFPAWCFCQLISVVPNNT